MAAASFGGRGALGPRGWHGPGGAFAGESGGDGSDGCMMWVLRQTYKQIDFLYVCMYVFMFLVTIAVL